MKAIGYIRVSTEGQVDGVSLDSQCSKIEAWSSANGYELLDVFTDAGISGSKYNRPGLHKALAEACKHKAALVVYSLSRLARSTRDALTISERLDKSGADLVSLTERIDTTSAAGKMVFRMLAVLAEFERDLTSERTKSALQHLKRQGKKYTRQAPFGYEFFAGKLIKIPAEQKTIYLIGQLRSEGMSLRQIAAELKLRGIRSKRGGSWSAKTVNDVLKAS